MSPNPSQGEVPAAAIKAAEERLIGQNPPGAEAWHEQTRVEIRATLTAALPAIRSQIDQEWEKRLEVVKDREYDEAKQELATELADARHEADKAQERLKEVERQREEDAIKLASRSAEAVADAQRAQRKAEAALSQGDQQVREAIEELQEIARSFDAYEHDQPFGGDTDEAREFECDDDFASFFAARAAAAHLALTQRPSSTSPQQEVEEAAGHDFELLTTEQVIGLTVNACRAIETRAREVGKDGAPESPEREFARGEMQVAQHIAELLEEPIPLRARPLTQPPADPEVGEHYTTEQARMRLRETFATHEPPSDGTSEEYFIRAAFPDVSESPGNSREEERTITINKHDFKVPGRTMAAADLYVLPIPPLDPYKHDLFQETPGNGPDTWIDPRQIVDFNQGSVFFSAPRHINASASTQPVPGNSGGVEEGR